MTELILLSVKPEMPQTSRFDFGTSVFRWPEVKMHTEQRVAFESFSVLPKISRHSCVRVFGIICTSLCLLQEFPWILQTLKLCNCKLQLLLAADKFLKVSAARLSQAIPRTPFRFTSWSMNSQSFAADKWMFRILFSHNLILGGSLFSCFWVTGDLDVSVIDYYEILTYAGCQ